MTDAHLRDLSRIRLGVIHCADTPNGYSRYGISDIDAWHEAKPDVIRQRVRPLHQHGSQRWAACAYHYVIHTDGGVHNARALEEIPSATSGVNSASLAICMIGTTAFTQAQWDALKHLTNVLDLALPGIEWRGHQDFANRICPGFDVQSWIANNRVPHAAHICNERIYRCAR